MKISFNFFKVFIHELDIFFIAIKNIQLVSSPEKNTVATPICGTNNSNHILFREAGRLANYNISFCHDASFDFSPEIFFKLSAHSINTLFIDY